MIRLNHPEFHLRWSHWAVGASWACLSNNGPRFASVYLGPVIFQVCF
jgi:uncharacterized protein (DUF736 family)